MGTSKIKDGKKSDHNLMIIDPAYGTPKPYPSEANQYRAYHGRIAWLYNPYTGTTRNPMDIGTDPCGVAIENESRNN